MRRRPSCSHATTANRGGCLDTENCAATAGFVKTEPFARMILVFVDLTGMPFLGPLTLPLNPQFQNEKACAPMERRPLVCIKGQDFEQPCFSAPAGHLLLSAVHDSLHACFALLPEQSLPAVAAQVKAARAMIAIICFICLFNSSVQPAQGPSPAGAEEGSTTQRGHNSA